MTGEIMRVTFSTSNPEIIGEFLHVAKRLGLQMVRAEGTIVDPAAVLKLSNHWVLEMRCDNEAKTDQVYCACGAICSKQPSVGAAAQAWASHVFEAMGWL